MSVLPRKYETLYLESKLVEEYQIYVILFSIHSTKIGTTSFWQILELFKEQLGKIL